MNARFIEVSGRFKTDFNRDKISQAGRDTAEVLKGQIGLTYPADCREAMGGTGGPFPLGSLGT